MIHRANMTPPRRGLTGQGKMDDMTESITEPPVDASTTALRAMVADQFGRIRSGVEQVTKDLPQVASVWRPDPDANSIAWLVWHLARVEDDHVAHLAGREQVWTSAGWCERFALPFDPAAHGYGHSSADVAAVRTAPADLAAYHADVHEMALAYGESLTVEELARVVDTRWDPPVTASVRLVSLIGDCLQHLGQAKYVRGMAERASIQ